MNSPLDVSIIIVSWNTKDLLIGCLKSIQASVGVTTYEVFVVDNASNDGSQQAVEENFRGVRLIKNLENAGFARANNQAAQYATGRYLFFLNPDTIAMPGAIQSLVSYAEEHLDIGILGPRISNPDHSLQRSAWREYPGIRNAIVDALYLWKVPWFPFAHSNEYTSQDLANPRDVGHLLGASLMIRQETWEQIGPFDEDYYMFLEETDYCHRAHANGWRVVYYPFSEIIHYGRQSVIQQPMESYPHLYRSYCRYYRKNNAGDLLGLFVIKTIIAIACVLRVFLWVLRFLFSFTPSDHQRAIKISRSYWKVLFEISEY